MSSDKKGLHYIVSSSKRIKYTAVPFYTKTNMTYGRHTPDHRVRDRDRDRIWVRVRFRVRDKDKDKHKHKYLFDFEAAWKVWEMYSRGGLGSEIRSKTKIKTKTPHDNVKTKNKDTPRHGKTHILTPSVC